MQLLIDPVVQPQFFYPLHVAGAGTVGEAVEGVDGLLVVGEGGLFRPGCGSDADRDADAEGQGIAGSLEHDRMLQGTAVCAVGDSTGIEESGGRCVSTRWVRSSAARPSACCGSTVSSYLSTVLIGTSS